MADGLPRTNPISLDVSNTAALEEAIAAHDVVISLIPYTLHAQVIKAAIKGKTHVVTTSYVSPAMRELDAEAKAAGIVVMNEIGLDPGIDHLYAVKIIDEVHAKGGKVGPTILLSKHSTNKVHRSNHSIHIAEDFPHQRLPTIPWVINSLGPPVAYFLRY